MINYCINCLHFWACTTFNKTIQFTEQGGYNCPKFKSDNSVVKLPFAFNQTLYMIDEKNKIRTVKMVWMGYGQIGNTFSYQLHFSDVEKIATYELDISQARKRVFEKREKAKETLKLLNFLKNNKKRGVNNE